MPNSCVIKASRKLILGLLGAAPFFLLIANSLVLADGPRYLTVAQSLVFAGSLILGATILVASGLLIQKKVPMDIGLTGVFVPMVYAFTLAPLSFSIIGPVAAEAAKNPSSVGIFSRPFYKMSDANKANFEQKSKTLEIGQPYSEVIRVMPPVPDGAPLFVRDIKETRGVILCYYLEKQSEDKASYAYDKHITLTFDGDKKLVKIDRAL